MKETILKDLERNKAYTVSVAQAMPEKDYRFKPTPAVWNYIELMHHIAYSLNWMLDNYVTAIKSDWKPGETPSSKQAVVGYLTESFQKIEKQVKSIELTDESISGFYFMLEHNAHHRGQAVTYLRCCGITPPEFPF